jgi:hypothetical protein
MDDDEQVDAFVRAEPHSASQRVRRCRSGVIDRYTDIEHVHLDGDDDDGVEFRSQDEAGYGNGRDSDGVELRSEDELCYCTVQ